MRLFKKSTEYEIKGAKAQNYNDFNCPDLMIWAIENQSVTELYLKTINSKTGHKIYLNTK